MSSTVVDNFTTAWQADASGLWSLAATAAAARYGPDGRGMEISASAGSAAAPAPYAERRFTPALDLSDSDELRFWLRSSRPGDGRDARPVYLELEATTDPPAGAPWRRMLPLRRANAWELQRLWLGDMSAALRGAVGFLRLRSLDGRIAFEAAIDDLIASVPQPIADVEEALTERLDGTFQVSSGGAPTAVPAILDLPEAPGTRTAPYILVTPWSVLTLGHRGGETDVVDNPTANGAHVRTAPVDIQLEYRIDVFAEDRDQKSSLLERIVVELLGGLLVNGEALQLEPFRSSQEDEAIVAPGRTPLFYRLVVQAETGPREFRDLAGPFLLVGSLPDRSTPETVQA
jgi:hypothetical protein